VYQFEPLTPETAPAPGPTSFLRDLFVSMPAGTVVRIPKSDFPGTTGTWQVRKAATRAALATGRRYAVSAKKQQDEYVIVASA
jgi:hypothetical protein